MLVFGSIFCEFMLLTFGIASSSRFCEGFLGLSPLDSFGVFFSCCWAESLKRHNCKSGKISGGFVCSPACFEQLLMQIINSEIVDRIPQDRWIGRIMEPRVCRVHCMVRMFSLPGTAQRYRTFQPYRPAADLQLSFNCLTIYSSCKYVYSISLCVPATLLRIAKRHFWTRILLDKWLDSGAMEVQVQALREGFF